MESEYLKRLLVENKDVGERYKEKIAVINGLDPYTLMLTDLNYETDGVPPVKSMDLVSYFVFTHSYYSKSLQSYKYFESGFVVKIGTKLVNQFFVLVAKVKHSQRANDKALDVWSIVANDGSIITAHCTCMAGNSEVCSHVGAILFAAEYANNKKEAMSCTDLQAVWPIPSTSTNVPIVPVRDMNWGNVPVPVTEVYNVPPMSSIEIQNMLKKVTELEQTCALMSIIEPFASILESQINQVLASDFEIFKEGNCTKSYSELMALSRNMTFSMDQKKASEIEKATRNQSTSSNWYKQRAGRITASKMKLVCKTQISKLSISLIKAICYPTKVLFTTPATSWGIQHEINAVEEYERQMLEEDHEEFQINEVVVIVSPAWPQLSATPDRLVFCNCCLGGCLEVKCQYILKTKNIDSLNEFADLKSSCLIKVDNVIRLDKKHSYYYQIQMQMAVTRLKYCDFVIWSPNIYFRERDLPDDTFWSSHLQTLLKFHAEVIMPELLGRFFTRSLGTATVVHYCTCNGVDDGRPMISCDSDECEVVWFHMECVGLTDIPDGCWFCKKCFEKMQSKSIIS